MSDREKIIAAAQEQDPDIGDSAMIVEMEWGYWVGGDSYVPKEPSEVSDRM